jgi:choloylglycine hydrolase
MNEAGLVVESMALVETEYPLPDTRPAIDFMQWIQYQLDMFSTIEEVIASDSQIRVTFWEIGVHFLVCDRTGNCATIEFIGNKLVYHTKEGMPVKTLTNSIYAESISFWEKDKIPQPDKFRSIERFIRAATMVKNYDPKKTKSPIDFAFRILRNVENKSKTQWSIVYDLKNLSIYFRTLDNQRIRHFDLKSFDFSCATPVRVLDVQAELSGDISDEFINYTYQINRNLIGEAYRKITEALIGGPFSNFTLDTKARYPDEMTSCIDKK